MKNGRLTDASPRAAEAPPRDENPKETTDHNADRTDKSRDDGAADTHTQQSSPIWAASGLSPSPTSTRATSTPGADDSLSANNTAEADSESGATVDSSNINTNNVTVVTGGPVEQTKNWLEENKWM